MKKFALALAVLLAVSVALAWDNTGGPKFNLAGIHVQLGVDSTGTVRWVQTDSTGAVVVVGTFVAGDTLPVMLVDTIYVLQADTVDVNLAAYGITSLPTTSVDTAVVEILEDPLIVDWEYSALYDSVVIANGDSLSDSIDTEWAHFHGLIMPDAWTAADITFLVAASAGGPYRSLFDEFGNEVTLVADDSIAIALGSLNDLLAPWRYIVLRSGTVAAPVAQGADRVIVVILKR